jgi:hypothetical protein
MTDRSDYEQAVADAAVGLELETLAKIRDLKRRADGARARARDAQARFERRVVLYASAHPEREDWYESPGPVDRTQLINAAGLTSRSLATLMNRYRGEFKEALKRARRTR